MIEDEMVGWHHRLKDYEFEQAPEDCEGQGRLVCCSPWGSKELDRTQQLNNNSLYVEMIVFCIYWIKVYYYNKEDNLVLA